MTDSPTNCIKVLFDISPGCTYPGYPVTYIAGSLKIPLTGNIPKDSRWHNRLVMLYGRLVENGGCMMFFVDRGIPCSDFPMPSTVVP